MSRADLRAALSLLAVVTVGVLTLPARRRPPRAFTRWAAAHWITGGGR
jgi:hypothetical protein